MDNKIIRENLNLPFEKSFQGILRQAIGNEKIHTMKHNITFRSYGKRDKDFLFKLLKLSMEDQIIKNYGEWDDYIEMSYLEESISEYPYEILLFDGKEIGCLSVQETPSEYFINEIQMIPEYQSQGIGTEIIKQLIRKAERQQKSIRLEVLQTNTAAIKLYARLGFIKTDEKENHVEMKLAQDFTTTLYPS